MLTAVYIIIALGFILLDDPLFHYFSYRLILCIWVANRVKFVRHAAQQIRSEGVLFLVCTKRDRHFRSMGFP